MKISYIQHEFENTVLGKFSASINGLEQITLTPDDNSYSITMISNLPDDLNVAQKTRLNVDVSKEMAPTIEAKLMEVNSKFAKSWILHLTDKTLKIYVPIEFHEMFFSVLSSLPELTELQVKEIQSRLEFKPSQIQRYSFWNRSESEKAKDRRQELMQHYHQYKDTYDAATRELLEDIFTESVTKETNDLFKKILNGTYSDVRSTLDLPKNALISDMKQANVSADLIKKAMYGEYDNDDWPCLQKGPK